MGAEKEGAVEIRKKAKKSKEKSKKGKKNEVSDGTVYEAGNGGKYGIIEGFKNEEKEDGERGDNEEEKKKKKKKVKSEVGEGGGDGYGKGEKGNDDGMVSVFGNDDGNVMEKVEKKKRKREKGKSIGGTDEQLKEQEFDGAKGGSQLNANETCFSEMQNGKEVEAAVGGPTDGDVASKVDKKRKKKKKKMVVDSGALLQDNSSLTEYETQENKDHRGKVVKLQAFGEDSEPDSIEKPEKKKRKREKKKDSDDSGATEQDILAEKHTKSNANSTMNEELNRDLRNGVQGKRKNAKLGDNGSEDPNSKKSKKVRFSGNVEVFSIFDDKLVRGKRFSKEEDEIVKESVFKYIEEHCLGEEGLNMVLNCKSHPEIKNCWKYIATSLPHRPRSSIYYRAQVLFRRDEKRKWTEDEIELLRKSHMAHGNQWKDLAEELGKHRVHVKDTWRRIRHENLKKGHWSQEEYQALFDLVNTDLRMKYSEEKKSKYGMLRDNIAWTAISDKLSTRAEANCCLKWYNQLTSSMVAEGLWADADDYRLVDALFQLDASCIEDVDWDNLLDHRSGDVCLKRWNQMVHHIDHSWNKSFADQVEILAKRYCRDLLEAREAWDSKPIVP